MIYVAIIMLIIGLIIIFFNKGVIEIFDRDVDSKKIGIGILMISFFLFVFSSLTKIGVGQVGVTSLFGKVDNSIMYSGLNFVNPLKAVEKMDIKLQEYTMTHIKKEGEGENEDDAVETLTSDGLTVKMEITIWYRLRDVDAPTVFSTIGVDYEYSVIRPSVRSVLRDISVAYPAIEIYSTRRDEFVSKITAQLLQLFGDKGIILEKVLLRDVRLPDKVREAIDSKIAMEQESQKMVYVLQKEKQEAERKEIEAHGINNFQKIVASGISDPLLKWKAIEVAEKLVYSHNAKIVLLGDKSGLPIMLSE